MKSVKKIGIFALTIVLALGVLASCGGGGEEASEDKTIKVAATPTPHAEILNSVADKLAEEGWTLEVTEMDEYALINPDTVEGDVDANYFQHVPYLEQYNEENGTELVSVANMHYEKMAIYAGTKDSLDAIEAGDKIGVPNDATNEARALKVLQEQGLIKLKGGASETATVMDIEEYPKGELEIVEIDAASIPKQLPDLAFGVINANYAIGAGIMDKVVVTEGTDEDQENTYVNVIVVNKGNEESEKTKALVAALQSDETKKFIEETYNGAVVAKF